MRIFTNNDLVDFEAPIYTTPEQKARIISFFKQKFSDVETKDVVEPDREYEGKTKTEQHKWTAKDYLKLFSTDSNDSIADELHLETAMGVQVKRGTFVMDFLKWKKIRGENLPITERLIQRFLEETES